MTKDLINPSHYKGGAVECIEALQSCLSPQEYQGFLRGNVIKYLWRLGNKDESLQELKKAQWYLNDEIQRVHYDLDFHEPSPHETECGK